ncbi:MAG TPA: permease [Roseiflexaceae bacterium]|nr:permease [Roseiflexaceae bacterium]
MRSESLPIAPARRARLPLGWLWYVPVVLLVWLGSGWALPPALVPLTLRAQGLVTIFLGIFFEAFPFVVAGVLVSAVVGLWVSEARIQRHIPRGPVGAALTGALLGLAVPVCECGTVPLARRLLHKGAPLPFGVAFLLAAPVINPVVIASTAVAFNGDPLILGGRVGLTLLIALTATLVIARLPQPERLLAPQTALHNDDCGCGHGEHERTLGGVLRHSAGELVEMCRWLILGALLAATMQTFVPQSLLLSLGDGPLLSVLVLMALALLLSVCSTVDAFLALALSTAFGPGALLAFLVFGPMIDIKSGLMFLTTLSPRAVAWILAIVTPLVLAAGVLINLLVP